MAVLEKKIKSAKDELQDAIVSLGSTLGLNTAFTKFLELMATALGSKFDLMNAEERSKQYEDAMKGLTDEQVSRFAQMTALMYLAVRENEEDPIDILGDVYHKLGLNNEWNGQFFTPDPIARMMAMMVNPVSNSDSSKDYITIGEPACGSGTLVIGTTWAMIQNGVDYWQKSLFIAQDIDIRCVWMAYIQLTLYRIPAIIIHGNSLTTEEWSRWYTPYAVSLLQQQLDKEGRV